jgi:hypothetical protein
MKAWRRTEIATFMSLASCFVAVLALNASPLDDRYLDLLNGISALVLALVVAYRFVLGSGDGLARTGWICAGIALVLFAATQLFEAPFQAVEQAFHLEDEVDIAFLLVLPWTILFASRAEGIGRNAILLIAAAVVAQTASTAIDLFDNWLARTGTLSAHGVELLVDVSEFIFLQLYLLGLAFATGGKPAQAESERGVIRQIQDWVKYRGLSPNRFYMWHILPIVWRFRNPGGTPEEFYASRIQRQLRKGDFHPAIGRTARAVRARSELLDILLTHGLKPSDTVVDYGCGSFRLGAALIDHLEPGKYWGLDVIQEFLTLGVQGLDPAVVAEKRPHALVINDDNIAQAQAAVPDFIVSWHVCSKVPPKRLHDYFGKMISMMGPHTLVLVHYPETKRRRRLSRFSWSASRAAIAAVIGEIDPSLDVQFALVTDQVSAGVGQAMVKIRRAG